MLHGIRLTIPFYKFSNVKIKAASHKFRVKNGCQMRLTENCYFLLVVYYRSFEPKPTVGLYTRCLRAVLDV